MKRIAESQLRRLLSLFLVLSMCAGQVYAAEATATTVQLMKTEGTANLTNSAGRFLTVRENMRLYNGYHVETEAKSYAWVNLDDDKLTKLDESSEIELRKDGRKLEVLLNEGSLYFNVEKPLEDSESMNIRTSTMVVGIRGTCGWVRVIDRWNTEVSILEGSVRCTVTDPVSGQSKTTTVTGGERAIFTVYDPARAGDKCDIFRDSFAEGDIPGFVLIELVRDTPLCEKIYADSGINLLSVTREEAENRLKSDQADQAKRLEERERLVQEQERHISVDPVWKNDTPASSGSSSGTSTGGGTSSGPSGVIRLTMPVTAREVQDYLDIPAVTGVTLLPGSGNNTFSVDIPMNVPAGKTLTLNTGVPARVEPGDSMTVDGTAGLNDSLTNNGTITVNSANTLRVAGDLTNNTALTVTATGRSITEGTFINNGTLTLTAGAQVLAKTFDLAAPVDGWTVTGPESDGYYRLVQTQPPHTVTFGNTGETGTTGEDGTLSTLPDPGPDADGNPFDGWYTQPDGGGKKVTEDTIFTEDTTLYPHWTTPSTGTTYTITRFYNDGSGGSDTVTTLDGGKIATNDLEAPPSTVEGIEFVGWFTAASGGTEITLTTVFTQNTSIYAHWSKIVGGFIVTGGTENTDYTYTGGVLTVQTATPLTIASSAETQDTIFIAKDIDADVTLAGVNISLEDKFGYGETENKKTAFQVEKDSSGHVKVTLASGTNNYLTSGAGHSGLEMDSSTGTLTIEGPGALTAQGGMGSGSGIGGSYEGRGACTIIINGGDITAIGASPNRTTGTETGTQGFGGAGIGTSFNTANVTINGGNITAYGGKVNLSGGEYSCVGIGASTGTTANVTINGGTVNAFGTVGIGNYNIWVFSSSSTTTITGGVVNATGGSIGIGGYGNNGTSYGIKSSKVSISGGADVTAITNSTNGPAIGGASSTITLADTFTVRGNRENLISPIPDGYTVTGPDGDGYYRLVQAQPAHTITFEGVEGEDAVRTTGADGRLTSLPNPLPDKENGDPFDGWYTMNADGEIDEMVTINSVFNKDTTVYPYWIAKYTITFINRAESSEELTDKGGVIPSWPEDPKITYDAGEYTFEGWYTDPVNGIKVESTHTFIEDTTLYARWSGWGLSSGVLNVAGEWNETGHVIPSYTVTATDGGTTTDIPWYEQKDDIISVVIEDGVTSIGDYAFYSLSNATSVTIPDSVTSIGDAAFKSSGLTSVDIPSSVTTMGGSVFQDCISLVNATFDANGPQIVIPTETFSGCIALTTVYNLDHVTGINRYAFSGCSSLTNINIPSVTSIGEYAFKNCEKLSSDTLNLGNLQTIGTGVFSNCKAFTSITIPSSVTSIATLAFDGCSNLTYITYTGTQAQWNSITKETSTGLEGKTITCTDGNVTVPTGG